MKSIKVSSFGPIQEGEVEFGDLTVLVGPQASGKSLLVQLFKAIEDIHSIKKVLQRHGFDWSHGGDPFENFLSLYFGGGMETIWHADTAIVVDGAPLDFKALVMPLPQEDDPDENSVTLIPAQRVMVLGERGWAKSFRDCAKGVPYCFRMFSELVHKMMDLNMDTGKQVFPCGALKMGLIRLLDEGIYTGGKVKLHVDDDMLKKIVLEPDGGGVLPYSAWSAGQREFTPLLQALCVLLPHLKVKVDHITTVVIEEPEMGLHPQAIMSFVLLTLMILDRGYKVIISTHSPVVLDVIWAIQELMRDDEGAAVDEDKALDALEQIFKIDSPDPTLRKVLASALEKSYRTFYLQRTGQEVTIKDVSTLDPGSDDASESGWGGLSGFSGDTVDVVSRAVWSGGER